MKASGGGGPALKRQHDSAMAMRMKQLDIKRHHMRCPLCTGIVNISSFYGHISTICRGGKMDESAA